MERGQVELFFPGERTGVVRAMKRLEKNRQIFCNPYTGLVSSSEFAYSLKDEGTIGALWVLGDMMGKRQVEAFYQVKGQKRREQKQYHFFSGAAHVDGGNQVVPEHHHRDHRPPAAEQPRGGGRESPLFPVDEGGGTGKGAA